MSYLWLIVIQAFRLWRPQMPKTVSRTTFQTDPLSTISIHRLSLSMWEARPIPVRGPVFPSGQQSRTNNMQRPDTCLQIVLLKAARRLFSHLLLAVSYQALSSLQNQDSPSLSMRLHHARCGMSRRQEWDNRCSLRSALFRVAQLWQTPVQQALLSARVIGGGEREGKEKD